MLSICSYLAVIQPTYYESHITNPQYSGQAASFYTPNSKYHEIAEPSTSSTTTKRVSIASNPFQTNGHKSILPHTPADQESLSQALQKNLRSTQKSKTSRIPQHDAEGEQATLSHSVKESTRAQTQKSSATKTLRHLPHTHDTNRSQQCPASPSSGIARQEMRTTPRQQIIRHVTATIEVPVKQEDIDDDEFEESASASGSVDVSPTAEILRARETKSSQHQARQRSKRSVQADDDDSYVEDDIKGGEAHIYASSSEEDDDELMMGAEVSPA